jgi:DNA-binding CsgD family transcriptional regulator
VAPALARFLDGLEFPAAVSDAWGVPLWTNRSLHVRLRGRAPLRPLPGGLLEHVTEVRALSLGSGEDPVLWVGAEAGRAWARDDALLRGLVLVAQEAVDAGLSPRQRDVLALKRCGLRAKEIAVRLGVAEATVRGHLRGVRERVRPPPPPGTPG